MSERPQPIVTRRTTVERELWTTASIEEGAITLAQLSGYPGKPKSMGIDALWRLTPAEARTLGQSLVDLAGEAERCS